MLIGPVGLAQEAVIAQELERGHFRKGNLEKPILGWFLHPSEASVLSQVESLSESPNPSLHGVDATVQKSPKNWK